MVEGSFLGTIYRWWLGSKLFAVLSAIWTPLNNAYNNMALVKWLRKPSKVQSFYGKSLFSRIIRAVLDFVINIISAIASRLRPAFENSATVKSCKGSYIINFEFLLGLFICGVFVTPHELWNNSCFVLGAFGFLLLYIILVGCGKREMYYPEKLGFPFLLFVLALVFSLFVTEFPSDSLRIFLFFLAAFAFMYVIAADITEPERLTKILAFIYVALMITSLYAIAQRVFNLVYASASYTDLKANVGVPGRVTSTLDNPNNFSEFLVLFLPVSVVFAATRKKPLWSLVLCLSLAAPAVALLMTYSRSGWISIMLAAFVYVWLRNKKLIPALIIVCIAAVPFLPDSVITRLTTLTNLKDSSSTHRLALWQGVLYMIRDYGLTGIGLGPKAFAALYPSYAQEGALLGGYHTQMLYMELIVEAGYLAFISFMWMALRNIKNVVISRRHKTGITKLTLIACAASLIGIAFSCCVEYIWFYPRDMFAYFILFGISLGEMRSGKEIEL